jgi:hypothetical protein
MSWKPQVIADSSGNWAGNALRFATKEEADANGRNLMMRWLAVREVRSVESDDPVSHAWRDGQLVFLSDEVQP